jgi:putative peptidoglycan lipid II flippase
MNLLKALFTVSSMTLLSRVLGFVRDAVIARVFGAGAVTDAFFVAFRLPNLLRRMFAEGAFSQAFVPIFAEVRNREGDDAARALAVRCAGALILALLLVTTLGVLLAPVVVMVTAPGFSAEPATFDLTVDLLRVTFPYILFISLTALPPASSTATAASASRRWRRRCSMSASSSPPYGSRRIWSNR